MSPSVRVFGPAKTIIPFADWRIPKGASYVAIASALTAGATTAIISQIPTDESDQTLKDSQSHILKVTQRIQTSIEALSHHIEVIQAEYSSK